MQVHSKGGEQEKRARMPSPRTQLPRKEVCAWARVLCVGGTGRPALGKAKRMPRTAGDGIHGRHRVSVHRLTVVVGYAGGGPLLPRPKVPTGGGARGVGGVVRVSRQVSHKVVGGVIGAARAGWARGGPHCTPSGHGHVTLHLQR